MLRIITLFSSFSILLPLIIGVTKLKWFGDKKFIKPFFSLITITTISECLNLWCSYNNLSNHFIFNMYTVVYLIGILFTFKNTLHINVFYTGFISVIMLTFWMFLSSHQTINTLLFSIAFIEMVVLSIFILYNLYKNNLSRIFQEPLFWIAFGTLTFCCCTLVSFMFLNQVVNKQNLVLASYLVIYIAFVNVLKNILYAKTFLCLKLNNK